MHLTTHHELVTPSLTRFTVNHHRRWSNLSIEMSVLITLIHSSSAMIAATDFCYLHAHLQP
jgi:hypothetical protein